MTTVHVVATQSESGAGFDWYWNKDQADKAYIATLSRSVDFMDTKYGVYQFEVDLPFEIKPGASIGLRAHVNEYISETIDDRCLQATKRVESVGPDGEMILKRTA